MAYCQLLTKKTNYFACDSYITPSTVQNGLIGVIEGSKYFELDAAKRTLAVGTV